MSKSIFISYATVDYHLVDILITFLGDVGIYKDDIFCTSVSGTLESGKDFVEQIKNNVQNSRIVLFLLSERYFSSYFCLAELGAAWALNQNILPIIVPPISTEEYNKTPLIREQALNIGSDDFLENFLKDLARKGVIENSGISFEKSSAVREFNAAVKKELGILRKDTSSFYMARLIEKKTRTELEHKRMTCHQLVIVKTPCDYTEPKIITYWKLNGLLDVETDSNITEHWISVGQINLSSAKIKFALGDVIDKGKDYKVFSIKDFYELP